MLDYIIKGGVMMLPLLLCSVLALGIVLERLWSLRRKRVLRYNLLQRLEELLREQKIPEATTLCKRHQSTLTRILLVMLLNRQRAAGHEEHVRGTLGVDVAEGAFTDAVADHVRHHGDVLPAHVVVIPAKLPGSLSALGDGAAEHRVDGGRLGRRGPM